MVEEHLIVSIPSPLFGETRNTIYTLKSSNKKLHIFTRTIDRVTNLISETNDIAVRDIMKELPPHMLFADNIWPGTYVLADFLDRNPSICRSRIILELGAGCALPSLVSSIHGAKRVVATDYPDDTIIGNISDIVKVNNCSDNVVVLPYAWGTDTSTLLDAISNLSDDNSNSSSTLDDRIRQYDVILLAEVLWKDTYRFHRDLLYTVQTCLAPTGIALISIAHRPTDAHSAGNDLEFLRLGEAKCGLQCIYLGPNRNYRDVFDDDRDEYCEVHLYAMFANEDTELRSLIQKCLDISR